MSWDNSSKENQSLTNFTEEIVSQRLWQYISPVLFIVGLTGNTLVVLVLKAMQFQRKATLIYFFVLALSDTVVLLVGLLHYWLLETFEINLRTHSDASCKILMFLTYFSMHMSSWTLVAVTVERFIMIKLPLRSSTLITITRTKISIVLIVMFLLLIDGYLLFTQHIEKGFCGSFENDKFLYYFDENIFTWIDFCILSVCPAAIMTTCNVLIVRELRRRIRLHREIVSGSSGTRADTRLRTSSLTKMLLSVSLLFVLTTVPISVYFIVDTFLSSAERDPHVQAKMDLALSIVYLIQYINYTVNFYIYVARGKRFREASRALICKSRRDMNYRSSDRGMSRRIGRPHNGASPSHPQALQSCGNNTHANSTNEGIQSQDTGFRGDTSSDALPNIETSSETVNTR